MSNVCRAAAVWAVPRSLSPVAAVTPHREITTEAADALCKPISVVDDLMESMVDSNLHRLQAGNRPSRNSFRHLGVKQLAKTISGWRVAQGQRQQEQAILAKDVITMTELVYCLICEYACLFNRCVPVDSPFRVYPAAPEFVSERIGGAHVSYFRGRLSTRHMSLILRGQANQLDIFILPASEWIGLSLAETAARRQIRFAGESHGQTPAWRIAEFRSGINTEEWEFSLLQRLIDSTLLFLEGR